MTACAPLSEQSDLTDIDDGAFERLAEALRESYSAKPVHLNKLRRGVFIGRRVCISTNRANVRRAEAELVAQDRLMAQPELAGVGDAAAGE